MFIHIADNLTLVDLAAQLDTLQALLAELTPLLERAEPPGFYLDLSGCEALLGPPLELAYELVQRIRQEISLQVSIGLGPNKIIAALAARLCPPGQVRQVSAELGARFLAPLPLWRLPGMDHSVLARLSELGIASIGQLAAVPPWMLTNLLGRKAGDLHRLACGCDLRALRPADQGPLTTLSHARTITPTLDRKLLRLLLWRLAAALCHTLRRLGKAARLVSISVDFGHGTTITRQKSLPCSLDAEQILVGYAWALVEQALSSRRQRVQGIRLTLGHLTAPGAQLGLVSGKDEQLYLRFQRLNLSLDRIRERYGLNAVQPGGQWAVDDGRRIVSWGPGRVPLPPRNQAVPCRVLGLPAVVPPFVNQGAFAAVH